MALFFEWAQTPADRGPLTKAHKKFTPRRRIHARQWAWAWTWCHRDRLIEESLEPVRVRVHMTALLGYDS